MSKIIQNQHDFEKYTNIKKIDKKHLKNVIESNFQIKAPQSYLDKIDWQNPDDPLRKMTIPARAENVLTPYELLDPIGDETYLATKNLVHRYPDRVLLLLTNHCQINCRFCFRRELTHHATPPEKKKIIHYIANHPEINEVIFSGGDPLTLSPAYLQSFMDSLQTIPHIKRIRIHTRIPIVNPEHITQKYLDLFAHIAKNGSLTLVLHVNHPDEIDEKNKALIQKLRKSALILSQTVLLKSVNDNPETLSRLCTLLVENNVKPYYLHHLDLIKGTDHFRVSIEEGKKMYQQLRGHISGHAIPEYVLDLPGGNGKVPVMWLQQDPQNKAHYQVTNFRGETISYIDPAYSPTTHPHQK